MMTEAASTTRDAWTHCFLFVLCLLLHMSSSSSIATAHLHAANYALRAQRQQQHYHHRRRADEATTTTEVDFVQECTASLLSTSAVDDGLISQDEFAQFLSNICVRVDACPPGTQLEYENLSIELQLSFVLFICSQDDEVERQACLEDLKASDEAFGYDLAVEEMEVLEAEMEELCTQAYLYASEFGLVLPPMVDAPSQAPVTEPTAATPTISDSDNGNNNNNDGSSTDTGDDTGDPNKGSTGDSSNGIRSGRNDAVSAGVIVGVTLAGVILVLATAVLLVRRHKKRRTGVKVKDQQKYIADVAITGDESIFTEDSDAFKYIPKGISAGYNSTHSVASAASSGKHSSRHGSTRSGSSCSGEHLSSDAIMGIKSRSVAQFDPTNVAAAIALGIGGEIVRRDDGSSTRSSHKSSPQLSLDSDKNGKMRTLTAAIEMADWDEVARLAGTMASDDSEEVSTMSEYSSAREQLSSVSSINSGDSVRVAQIEEMALRGDWSAVANAAAFFSSTKSMGDSRSGRVATNSSNNGVDASSTSPKRSFLDFVTGRRAAPSAAASAAIVPNSPDLVEHDSITEGSLAHVGAATTDDGPPSILDAGQSNTMETQSSSSRGSRPGGNESNSNGMEKRSKRWYRRILASSRSVSKNRSTDSADAVPIEEVSVSRSSKSKMLQAELNEALERGDWGCVEAISAKLDDSCGVVSSPSVKVSKLGEGDAEGILGATKRPASKSGKRPGTASVVSYRADIDKAVTEGDWEAVERLTTQILNTKPSPAESDAMIDTLVETNYTAADSLFCSSPSKSSPSKSPFRDTPSSSEWSQVSPPPSNEEKRQKIRKLIRAKDWKGVHVLSGIYEMEDKGLVPPTEFASKKSTDSADDDGLDFARGWLQQGDGSSGTPPPSDAAEGVARLPPPSPSTSTSTGASVDLREFERLVNAKDWKGLASFAGAEDELDLDEQDEGKLLPRDLFRTDEAVPTTSRSDNHSSSSLMKARDRKKS